MRRGASKDSRPRSASGSTTPPTKPARRSSTPACAARDISTRRYTQPARDREARGGIRARSISPGRAARATSSATCASPAMRRSPKNSCATSCRGAKARTSTPSRCSICSSGWSMRTISSSCRCSRRSTRRRTARCPSTCCSIATNARCIRARSTTAPTSAPACAWARSGAGSTRRATRPTCRRSTRSACRKRRCTTRFRGRAARTARTTSASAYRDETTDVSRSRNFQLAASRSEKRWHGFTRTIGLKYLRGDFELGQDEDNLEFGSSKLLFAEGTLSRRRVNDRLAPRKGYVLDFGVRLAQRSACVSDTDIAQTWGRLTWLIPQGEQGAHQTTRRGRRDDASAISTRCRRICASSRAATARCAASTITRSARSNANGNIIGGKYLAVASAEYEYYFTRGLGRGGVRRRGRCVQRRLQPERRRGRRRALALAAGADPHRRRVSRADGSADCRTAGGCTSSWGRTCEGAVAQEGAAGGAAARSCCCWCWSRRWWRGCCSRRRARAGWRATVDLAIRAAGQIRAHRRHDRGRAGRHGFSVRWRRGQGAHPHRVDDGRSDADDAVLARAAHRQRARARAVLVLPPEKDEPEPDEPLWIEPPLDVTVKDFVLADATIYREKEKLATLQTGGLSAQWKARELVIETLDGEAGRHRRRPGGVRARDAGSGHGARRAQGAVERGRRAREPRRPRAREPRRDRR